MDIISTKPMSVSPYPNTTIATPSKQLPKHLSKQESADKKILSESEQKEDKFTDEEINNLTDGLNKFLEYLNADLRFEIHEGTERIMVKLISKKDQRVLKEIPPKELLDTIAAIQEHVGMLLDKYV